MQIISLNKQDLLAFFSIHWLKKRLLFIIPAAVHIYQNILLYTQRTRHIKYLLSVQQKSFQTFQEQVTRFWKSYSHWWSPFKKMFNDLYPFCFLPFPWYSERILLVPGLAPFEPYLLAILCHRSFSPHKIIGKYI